MKIHGTFVDPRRSERRLSLLHGALPTPNKCSKVAGTTVMESIDWKHLDALRNEA